MVSSACDVFEREKKQHRTQEGSVAALMGPMKEHSQTCQLRTAVVGADRERACETEGEPTLHQPLIRWRMKENVEGV